MATHSNILAWRIPLRQEPGGLQFIGSQTDLHNRSNLACTYYVLCFICIHPGLSILLDTNVDSVTVCYNESYKNNFVLFVGNLLVIVFVSYFGAKLHRPKLIGIGCIIMGTGSILTALPHFFMG